jgi:malate synthase
MINLSDFKNNPHMIHEAEKVFSVEAIAFVSDLVRTFSTRVNGLLELRKMHQQLFDLGGLPHFLDKTKSIRESEWKVATIPNDLQDRRVEITGPVERKMIINALNSGANVFMADFGARPLLRFLMIGVGTIKEVQRLPKFGIKFRRMLMYF